MRKYGFWILFILIIVGFSDSVFLTYEYDTLSSVGCPVSPLINCLAVTSSKYSQIAGMPLALLGMFYYVFLFFLLMKKNKLFTSLLLVTTLFGVLFSSYLIYVQAFLIGLFCLYCLLSALVSFLIFGFSFWFFRKESKTLILDLGGYFYKYIAKPILFLIDPEVAHINMVLLGEKIFKNKVVVAIFRKIHVKKFPRLRQKIKDINFSTPIGLAAGFDYEGRLTQVLPYIGFGFGTVGTVTNGSYEGNPKPRLGRLPKSASLMVNKGFKSLGAGIISERLSKLKFGYPVGISIGRTNSKILKTVDSSIVDIVSAFKTFEKNKINSSYYELNISCPNLIHGSVSFYPLANLKKLLLATDKLRLKKPIFIKMPIDQTNRHTKNMLAEICKHKIAGVILGNLQTNTKDKSVHKDERKKYKVGKLSGKPTQKRSNELIKLAYKNYGDKLTIIGCGGVFSVEDAWAKFESGATLVQLITGMIFEGPQLISQINEGLNEMFVRKGFKNIAEVIGSNVD
ncbi:dihydroorotate dehydrogenase (quinone) [Candidatus Microgenomates bacterium]|nr:dihydroorotate dehydrogenase (quinone) [Candidatus Microgenomates bacterium]